MLFVLCPSGEKCENSRFSCSINFHHTTPSHNHGTIYTSVVATFLVIRIVVAVRPSKWGKVWKCMLFILSSLSPHHSITKYLHLGCGHISGHQDCSCGETVVPGVHVRRRHFLPSAREASADHVAESAPEMNVHCRVEHEIQTEVDCLKKKQQSEELESLASLSTRTSQLDRWINISTIK